MENQLQIVMGLYVIFLQLATIEHLQQDLQVCIEFSVKMTTNLELYMSARAQPSLPLSIHVLVKMIGLTHIRSASEWQNFVNK